MDFFGGYGMYAYGALQKQRQDVDEAKKIARRSRNEADDVRVRLERLHLATSAMWELIRDRTGLDDDDLVAKIQEIDLRDGQEDGRITPHASPAPVHCPACTRPNHRDRPACLYCGTKLSPVSPL